MGEERLQLRFLREADLPRILAMERENFTDPWSLEAFQGELGRACSMPVGIFSGQRLLAYSFSWQVHDETHLLNLSVGKDSQGRGIGRKLLRALLRLWTAKGSRRVHLEVSERNLRALSLYESLGFVAVGRRRAYYKDRSDAVLMTREIPGGGPGPPKGSP
jgi:ribosomal-protein-alanine N-acetyltransferase